MTLRHNVKETWGGLGRRGLLVRGQRSNRSSSRGGKKVRNVSDSLRKGKEELSFGERKKKERTEKKNNLALPNGWRRRSTGYAKVTIEKKSVRKMMPLH